MNMNKLLAAGLIAAVASTTAFAEGCGNGGFYVGLDAGMKFSKVRAKTLEEKDIASEDVEKQGDTLVVRSDKEKADKLAAANDAANKVLQYMGMNSYDAAKPEIKPGEDFLLQQVDATGDFGEPVNYKWRTSQETFTEAQIALLNANYQSWRNAIVTKATPANGPVPPACTTELNNADNAMLQFNSAVATYDQHQSVTEENDQDVMKKLIVPAAETVTTKANKSKSKFLLQLDLGYDWRLNDVMLRVDLGFGSAFGNTSLKDAYKVKEDWYLSLMPSVGYLVTPQFEIYATGGVKMSHFKVGTRTYDDILGEAPAKLTEKKKLKFVPVVGAGLRYEFTPNLFAKLEYNYEFKTSLKLPEKSIYKHLKYEGHVVKVGFGYRF